MSGVLFLLSSPWWFASFSESVTSWWKWSKWLEKNELENLFIHLLNCISNDLVLDKRISPILKRFFRLVLRFTLDSHICPICSTLISMQKSWWSIMFSSSRLNLTSSSEKSKNIQQPPPPFRSTCFSYSAIIKTNLVAVFWKNLN